MPPQPDTSRPSRPRSRLTRVAIVDDHPALRAGLEAAVGAEHDLVVVGSAADGDELGPLLQRTRPDVLLLDHQLPRASGLVLCRRIKALVPAPSVLLYSAFADAELVVPAIVAGVDGFLAKGAPTRELFEAIRVIAAGGHSLPSVSPEVLAGAASALDVDDRPILGMLVHRTPPAEIAATLRLADGELGRRRTRMLSRLTRMHDGAAARPPRRRHEPRTG